MPTITPKALAIDFDTNAKAIRKFLRHEAKEAGGTIGVDTPGKGGRWAVDLDAKAKAKMRKRFAAFQEAQAKARLARLAAAQEGDAQEGTPDEGEGEEGGE